MIRTAIASLRQNPNIRVLGSPSAHRLSILSFMVRHGVRYLHHNYVIALLNDLFGIQARGGCSCAKGRMVGACSAWGRTTARSSYTSSGRAIHR